MKGAFEKLKAHLFFRWSKAPQFIFCDYYTDKCRQQVTHLKTKIVFIDNESKLNKINIEGGDNTSGIFFLHPDFARGIDLKLPKNADVTIFCNNNDCKLNTTIACQMAGKVPEINKIKLLRLSGRLKRTSSTSRKEKLSWG